MGLAEQCGSSVISCPFSLVDGWLVGVGPGMLFCYCLVNKLFCPHPRAPMLSSGTPLSDAIIFEHVCD